jgi:hypothetical protein
MENKKISITTYSVEKITVNVQKVRLKPIDLKEETADPDSSVEPRMLEADSAAPEPGKDDSEKGEKK